MSMELGLDLARESGNIALQKTECEEVFNAGVALHMGLGMGMAISEQGWSQRLRATNPPVQLDLLPSAPVPRDSHGGALSWSPHSRVKTSDYGNYCGGGGYGNTRLSGQDGTSAAVSQRGFDVNRKPLSPVDKDNEEDGMVSSPNSTVSSFQMDFSIYPGSSSHATSSFKREHTNADGNANDHDHEFDRACSRASDEDEAGTNRKKLRLSKEQSAFLEESFKEHNTLNPKQKLALAKQLNLRPRQVEVWFQNRRARTKLKQTEVDCEYLKRCCETLTEENRRLHKELHELRALKVARPFYMQLPATTLTMCLSCERLANATATATVTATADNNTKAPSPSASTAAAAPFSSAKPRVYPFAHPSS